MRSNVSFECYRLINERKPDGLFNVVAEKVSSRSNLLDDYLLVSAVLDEAKSANMSGTARKSARAASA